MFCPNCGKDVSNSKFCAACGTAIVNEKLVVNDSEREEIVSESTKNNLFVIKVIIIFLLGVSLVGALWFIFGQPKGDKFLALLKDGEVKEAEKFYQNNLVDDEEERNKIYEVVSAEINQYVESYYADKMSYDEVIKALDVYSAFYTTETQNAIHKVDKLKESKEIFAEAQEKFQAEEYSLAYDLYEEVIAEDSNKKLAEEKMQECYEKISGQIFSLSEILASEGKWMEAISFLDAEIINLQGEDVNVAKNLMEEHTNAYVTEKNVLADAYAAEEKYLIALDELYSAEKEVGTNSILQDKIYQMVEQYEKFISEQVYAQIQERDFLEAASILNGAKLEMPNSSCFRELTDLLAEYTPVSIYDLEPYYVGELSLNINSNYKDIMGNVYEKTFRELSKGEVYNVYDISQKYSVLKGIVAVARESVGGEGAGYIRIYGDNVLLWEENNITSSTKPFEMSVNISGVTDLKIEINRGGNGWNGVHVLFADVTLQK